MSRVILLRLLAAVPLLAATTLLSFLLVHWAPGSFLDQLRLNPGISETVIEELARRYGVDRPWYLQYGSWLLSMARGDFGLSLRFQRPVGDLLSESVPRTLLLAGVAQIFCIVAGIALGVLSMGRLHRFSDRLACRGALALASIHPIVLAILGMTLVAHTGILPLGGGSSPHASSLSGWERGLDALRHFILPLTVLILVMLPPFFLQARGVLMELVPSPFVLAGRAQGLSERSVLFRHVFPASLAPLVSFAGSSIARLLNAAFLVEVVTGWPGMGRLALAALRERDPFLLLGTLVVAGVILSVGSLLADLLLAEVDPRIRLEEASS
ncbi:MAG: ABC transporter permease [Vicinamibacteria bacterium]